MFGSKDGVVQNQPAKDQEAKPDSDLVGHNGPERKCPLR